ncbi:phosphatase PAP2 family protein [Lysobacter olei]
MADSPAAMRVMARRVAELVRRRGWRLLLLFACILAPLWVLGELAGEVRERERIVFDEPLLLFARASADAGWDRFFLWLSRVGHGYGVVPADLVLIAVLALRRHVREAVFAVTALGGSALLNIGAKHWFARARPALWESVAPETSYSFPSAHAMGSATLACVLVALAWNTRWRWPVLLASAAFVLGVGLSRVYLGVHYPSDVLAGWAAALAWAMACYVTVFNGDARPWAARLSNRRAAASEGLHRDED